MSNEVKVALITATGGILATLIAVFGKPAAERAPAPSPPVSQAAPVPTPTAAAPPPVSVAAPPRVSVAPSPTTAAAPAVLVATPPPPTPESSARVTSPRSSSVPMAGSYALHWTNLGTVSGGEMDIDEVGPDDFGFKSRIVGTAGAFPFQFAYQGTIKKIAGSWYVEITGTNDPSIGRGAVRNDVAYDGSLLTFRADTGLVMAWRR